MYKAQILLRTINIQLENENILFIYIQMEFFDKLKSSITSPLKNFQSASTESSSIETWSLPIGNFSTNNIRLLLFRDCDKRGRKCLFDSKNVIKDKNGKYSYIESNGRERKELGEYIFGCVPLSCTSSTGTKRFHKYKQQLIWSQVFLPKLQKQAATLQNFNCPKENSSPLNSSFLSLLGQNLSSHVTTTQAEEGEQPRKRSLDINSLPPVTECGNTSSVEKCFSLPTQLDSSSKKSVLGLAIVINLPAENVKTISAYLQSMSSSIEECCGWFAHVSSKAYNYPSTFVQTLYDYSQQLKNLIFTRIIQPLVVAQGLKPHWKFLPSLTSELTQLILQHDERTCKVNQRIKLVLIAGTKKANEVAALFYLFKILLLQCSKINEADVGIDATAFCKDPSNSPSKETNSNRTMPQNVHGKLENSVTSISSTSTSSSPVLRVSAVQIIQPKVEEEKLQKRDYDSGIELELDSYPVSCANLMAVKSEGKSMRRSVSQKFERVSTTGSSSSSDELGTNLSSEKYSRRKLLSPQHSHEYEEVTFHLGVLGTDSHQSFNTLGLSEPNLDKLKIYNVASSRYLEPVERNTKIEELIPNKRPHPIQVNINFDGNSTDSKHSTKAHCSYCDSIGIVSKFSPLYYIQWIKSNCSTSIGSLSEDDFHLMKGFSGSKFIIVNIDKSFIRTINFDPDDCKSDCIPLSTCSNNSSSLVSNLLHNLQQLSVNDTEELEIENFLSSQLEFIEKIAIEFGENWLNSENSSCLKKKYSYLSLSENDLKLIYSLAKLRLLK